MGLLRKLERAKNAYLGHDINGIKHYNWHSQDVSWVGDFIRARFAQKDWKKLSVVSVFGSPRTFWFHKNENKIFFTGENPARYSKYKDNALPYAKISMGFDYLDAPNYLRFPLWIHYLFKPESTYEDIVRKVEEINEFLLRQRNLVKEAKEELIDDIEKDILIENLGTMEIRKVQENTLKNEEWLYDLENTYYDEIATSIMYLAIYKLLLKTDKDEITSIINKIVSDYDVSEDVNYLTDSVYERFQDVISTSEDEKLLTAVMQEVDRIRKEGKECRIHVEPVYTQNYPKDDDSKYEA